MPMERTTSDTKDLMVLMAVFVDHEEEEDDDDDASTAAASALVAVLPDRAVRRGMCDVKAMPPSKWVVLEFGEEDEKRARPKRPVNSKSDDRSCCRSLKDGLVDKSKLSL